MALSKTYDLDADPVLIDDCSHTVLRITRDSTFVTTADRDGCATPAVDTATTTTNRIHEEELTRESVAENFPKY